ncbi:MAG TPA: PQQ-binding-like beta-propeller repeat protein, partial [Polyangia bacterium]|nr:PQQ-binding-like beta-propeller repeat protein [Polyangia bacterium]
MQTTRHDFGALSCIFSLLFLAGLAPPRVALASPAAPAQRPSPARATGKPMSQSTLYPIKFGDTGRGGIAQGTTKAAGHVAWSREIGKTSSTNFPADVLIWNDHPLVATYDSVVLYDRDGKRLWDRRTEGGLSPAVAADGALYYTNLDGFIDAVDPSGKTVVDAAPFPGRGRRVRVEAFWPRPKDFIAVLDQPPSDDRRLKPGASPNKGRHGPSVTVMRNDYPTRYGDWSTDFAARPALPPVLVPGQPIVALVLGQEVVRTAPEDKSTEDQALSRFPAPLAEMVDWSVDGHEVYAMIGYEAGPTGAPPHGAAPVRDGDGDEDGDEPEPPAPVRGPKALVVFSGAGKTLWRWRDDKDHDTWVVAQPPIRLKGQSDRVCVLTEGRVLMVEAGKAAWTYDLRSELLRHGAKLDDGE